MFLKWAVWILITILVDVVGIVTVGVVYRGICTLTIRSKRGIATVFGVGFGIAQIVWVLIHRDLFKSFSVLRFSDWKVFVFDYLLQPPVLILFGLTLLAGLFFGAPFETDDGYGFVSFCFFFNGCSTPARASYWSFAMTLLFTEAVIFILPGTWWQSMLWTGLAVLVGFIRIYRNYFT